jgi:Uma2 family endonuclease
MTYAEYLELEQTSEERHEFLDGELFAMAGGTGAHARVKANLSGMFYGLLRGKPCSFRDADQRVRIVATGLSTYPDLSVVCGARVPDVEDPHALTNPTLLAEVLSPGTAGYDRGAKFDHYARIPTLQQVIFVDSTRRHVDVYTRADGGRWTREGFESGAVPLASVDVVLQMDELYEGWDAERELDAQSA